MKTEREIRRKLREFDKMDSFDYQKLGNPQGEWMMWSDKGFKGALEWVLGEEKK